MPWIIEDGVLRKRHAWNEKTGIAVHLAEEGKIVIPDGVKGIGLGAFMSCRKLTKIHLPDSVEFIEANAFEYCSALTQIRMPEGIKRIDREAFGCCYNLESLRIPMGTQRLGGEVLHGCDGLKYIFLPDRFWSILDRDMIDQLEYIACPISLKEVPTAMRRKLCIGFAMEEKEYSSELFNEYMAYIKRNCRRLCETAFDYPPLLRLMCREKLISAGSIDQFIEEASDREETELTAVLLDYQANVLTMKAVFKARERKERQMERQEDQLIERIAARAEKEGFAQLNFAADGKLDRFENRSRLKNFIEWQGGRLLASVSEQVDYLISNEPNSDRCREAKELGIEVLSEWHFMHRASQNKEVIIPEGEEVIPTGIFYGCTGIEKVTIASTVKKIEMYAFRGCSALKSIEIPASVQEIDAEAFRGCSGLEKIVVAPDHPVYRFEDGMLMTKDGTLTLVLPRCEEVRIPEGITSIGSCAFMSADELKRVEIPAAVSSIGARAFGDCELLEKIELPDGLKEIGWGVFSGCRGLQELRLPDGIVSVPHAAMRCCKNLKKITLPKALAVIEDSAFEQCSMLEEITLPANLRMIGGQAFWGCTALKRISVPERVGFIGSEAFRDCSALEEAQLPEELSEIADGLFMDCSALKEILIPEMISKIGWRAFKGCRRLALVKIPNFSMSIEKEAFAGCIDVKFIRW